MNPSYAAAVEVLFQAALSDFVSERKRLAAELKANGDKANATLLSKLARPPVSAWAVNQLWWREPDLFAELIEAAQRVKAGDRDAGGKLHRELLGELRQRAAAILVEAGNAASEGTLRRVVTTLSALAASGGFGPDLPGALVADRDPPGFETFFGASMDSLAPRATTANSDSDSDSDSAEVTRQRAADEQARRAEAAEQTRREAERKRLSAALEAAQDRYGARQRDVARLERELESARGSLEEAQALVAECEAKLAAS